LATFSSVISRSSGTPSLDEAALSTVRRQWRFQPATRGGVAVSYAAILPIRFTIRCLECWAGSEGCFCSSAHRSRQGMAET